MFSLPPLTRHSKICCHHSCSTLFPQPSWTQALINSLRLFTYMYLPPFYQSLLTGRVNEFTSRLLLDIQSLLLTVLELSTSL